MKRILIFGLVCLFSEGWSDTVTNTAQICYVGAYNSQNTIISNSVSVPVWERLLGKVWDLLTKEGVGSPSLTMAGATKLGNIFGTYTLDPAYPGVHTLVVQRPGYFPATRTIDLDQTQKKDIGLCSKVRNIPENTWKMWSPPARPAPLSSVNGSTITVGSDLGGIDRIGDMEIRCFRWDEGVEDDPLYGRYRRPAEIRTGYSYWLKSYGAEANLLAKDSVNPSTQTITLTPGWNQIGNPFNFMVKKSNISVDIGTLTDLWGWTDTEYKSSEAILPWKGYFVYANNPCTLTISPIPYDNTSVSAFSILNNNFLWRIQLMASSGIYSDNENFIGVGRNGKGSRSHEPPTAFGGFVRFSMDGYAEDIREEMKESNVWNISLQSNETGEPITLSWSDVSAIPEEYGVWLIDGDNVIDMRENSKLKIKNSKLKIKIAKGGLINERLEITDVISYPNPSSGEVTFRSTLLTSGAELKVKIYNIIGQVVAETGLISEKQVNDKAQVCIYASKFSCFNNSNQKLANGLYFFQIEASQNGKSVSKVGRMVISR